VFPAVSWFDLRTMHHSLYSKLRFLLRCKHNNIFPSHLSKFDSDKFYLHDTTAISRLNRFLHNSKTKILNLEIFDLNRTCESIKEELCRDSIFLSNFLPTHIWNSITKYHLNSFNNFSQKLFAIHNKKFNWLRQIHHHNYVKNIKPIKFFHSINKDEQYKVIKDNGTYPSISSEQLLQNITILPSEFSQQIKKPFNEINEKWFINLTNTAIPPNVANLLQLGDKFSLPISTTKKTAVHEFIKDIEGNTNRINIHKQIKIRNIATSQLHKFLFTKSQNNPTDNKISYMLKCTREFVRKNPDIIFTGADKGNATVVLNKSTYTQKMEELLSDHETYLIIKKNPTSSIERNLNATLKKWLHHGFITKNEFLYLRSSDSLLPKAYGLPKTHKVNVPYRIIVSSVNTALYSFAKFLQKIISNNLPVCASHINNSFDLCRTLSGSKIDNNQVLVSFDVVSLFTNVPLDLALLSIERRWTHIERSTKIPKNELLTAVRFVLSSTYFTFNNIIYKQTYGTPMGSPLSPIIADIVMQDLETNVLNSINIHLPFYYRYVDDIVFATQDTKVNYILETFNNYHQRIKFTVEKENNRCLSFLDLLLIVKDNTIIIDWFHKKSFSGRFLSFFSQHPICHKIGTIYGLIDHAILLSHPSFHHKSIKLCIQLLIDNDYPLKLIFNTINRRLKKLFVSSFSNIPITSHNDKALTNSDKDDKKVLVFPYIKRISEMISSVVPKSEYIIGYRCLNKLNMLVKTHKDKEQLTTNNNVIYKICCKDCDASYVGQTKRQLGTRLREHRNNIRLDQSKHSVVSEHIREEGHVFDWDNVSVLDYEPNYHKRLISEMVHIKEQKNGLNFMSDTELLDDCYSDILNVLGSSNK